MNYRVLVADEAIEDIFDYARYIYFELCNPKAADRLLQILSHAVEVMGIFPLKFSDSGIRYRGYIIHKRVLDSYMIFYIINEQKREVYVLRVMKDIMDWQTILRRDRIYHFKDYSV